MLFLPLIPSLTYSNIKKLKDQKWVTFQKITFETIFQKVTVVVWFWKNFRRPPTCPKFNTHKKVVVHFFIPMLLLPKTPPLTYPNIKRFKGPKTHSLTSLHFTMKRGESLRDSLASRYRGKASRPSRASRPSSRSVSRNVSRSVSRSVSRIVSRSVSRFIGPD